MFRSVCFCNLYARQNSDIFCEKVCRIMTNKTFLMSDSAENPILAEFRYRFQFKVTQISVNNGYKHMLMACHKDKMCKNHTYSSSLSLPCRNRTHRRARQRPAAKKDTIAPKTMLVDCQCVALNVFKTAIACILSNLITFFSSSGVCICRGAFYSTAMRLLRVIVAFHLWYVRQSAPKP